MVLPELESRNWPGSCWLTSTFRCGGGSGSCRAGCAPRSGSPSGWRPAPSLTLFDEPYTGLDAVARQLFYDLLLADFPEHPRTVVLSTHLIDEAADLLEHVVMLDRGRVVLDARAYDVRGTTVTVSGPAAAVAEFAAGRAGLAPAAARVAGRSASRARWTSPRRPAPRAASEPGTPVAAAAAGPRRQSFRWGEGERMTPW